MEKGEVACNEQFLKFSHSIFKRLVLQTCKNQGLFGKGLNNPEKKVFQKIVGKGENSCNQAIFFFLTVFFLHIQGLILSFGKHFNG